MKSRRNSSGIFSQDSIRCSSVKKSKVYCTDWEKHQKISQEEFYSCRCSTTFPVEQKTMNKNVWQTPNSYLCTREDLEKDNGHLLVLVLRSSGTLSKRIVHKESGQYCRKNVGRIRRKRTPNLPSGFLSVVENGQYFLTKDTADLSQFHAVACREYTLPREEEASQPKGWIQGNTKIGPVLEVATSYLHGKHGVEIRIWSLNRNNTHSSVRISHGSNKFVMNLNNNDTEIPEDQLEKYALKLSAKDFACRSKAKAKPQRREPAGSFFTKNRSH